MSIRKLALATVVIAGVLGFAGKANAQVIVSDGVYYTTPVVYSSYYTPTYYTYTPGVTYTSYSAPVYTGWYGDSYRSPYYTRYYSPFRGYSGPNLYVGPRGVAFRGWRW